MYAVGTSTSVISVATAPRAERDRHRHHEGGVQAPVPHQRRKAEEGGERRQQDRPEAVDAGLARRERQAGRLEIPLVGRDSPGLQRQAPEVGVHAPRPVDEVDHDQAVVDHHAGQIDTFSRRKTCPHTAPMRPNGMALMMISGCT